MVLMVRKLTDLAEKDRRILMNSGMHVLMISEYVPGEYTSSPFVCPFGNEGYCEGIKDEDITGRCEVINPADLLNCELYKNFINNPDFYVQEKPKVDTNADTVSIRHDDVIKMSRRPSRECEIPLEEQANEGKVDISRCPGLVRRTYNGRV